MSRLILFVLLLAPSLSHAKGAQKNFELTKEDTTWSFSYRWMDTSGTPQNIAFALPAEALEDDREERTWLPRKELNESMVSSIRKWAKTRRGPAKIKASAKGSTVLIEASGPRRQAKTALRAAEEVRDQAMYEWLGDHRFTELKGGLSFDHALLVNDYIEPIRPVAEALRRDGDDARAFAERALSFVASIPYETRKRKGGDPGYRRPLALLTRNRGDCDSKAVLYLALIRAAHPEIPAAVVYVPGHALTAIGVPAQPGDRGFEVDDTTYIYAEPVGPALYNLGQPAKENRRSAKRGEVRIVPADGNPA